MKNLFKVFGVIALIAVIGFAFTACGDSTDDDSKGDDSTGGNGNFVSVGDNPVGGKIYYEGERKIEFAVSTGTNGKYTGYRPRYDDNIGDYGDYVFDANGKYIWDIHEVGTYIWNEDEKTVTIRTEKISLDDGNFKTKSEYKTLYTAIINQMINQQLESMKEEEGWTQAQLDAYIKKQLAQMGYSSIAQYVDAMIDEAFGDHPYTYSFSNDGKSLLMERQLPNPKGTDELAGNTYYGSKWYDDEGNEYEQPVKDTHKKYEFRSDKTFTFTYTNDYGWGYTYTGYYSYDSTKKEVYLKAKIDGKTAAEYYDTVTVSGNNPYIDDDAYKAAETNDQFGYYSSYRYDPTQKLIG